MTVFRDGDILDSMDPALRIFNAAMYAGATFFRLASAEITAAELNEVMPKKPGDRHKARMLGMFALLLHQSDLSDEAMRTLVHRGESEFTKEDLGRVSDLVSDIAESMHTNEAEHVVDVANRWLGFSTTEENRCAVVEELAEHAGKELSERALSSCMERLGSCDKKFLEVDRDLLRDLLVRMEVAGNAGGKDSEGRPRLGMLGIAAKLAVSVRAFKDKMEGNSKEAFRAADVKQKERMTKEATRLDVRLKEVPEPRGRKRDAMFEVLKERDPRNPEAVALLEIGRALDATVARRRAEAKLALSERALGAETADAAPARKLAKAKAKAKERSKVPERRNRKRDAMLEESRQRNRKT